MDVHKQPLVTRMHRLVQGIVRSYLPDWMTELEPSLHVHLIDCAGVLTENWVKWENRWEILPLTQAAWLWMDWGDEEGALLANEMSLILRDLGTLKEAKGLLLKAIAIDEKVYEADHPTLATRYSKLALVEQDLGNLEEAKGLLLRAVTIDEKAYRADHPTLAKCYSSLASVEQGLGNMVEAKRLLLKAIAIEKKTYEADHPVLARSYSNLAVVENKLGNPEKAKRLLLKAITIEEKEYEADNPRLAAILIWQWWRRI